MQEDDTSRSESPQDGDGGDANFGEKTSKPQFEEELRHDQVQDEYNDSKDDRAYTD